MTKPKVRLPLNEDDYKATLFVESTKRRKFQEALEWIAKLPCTGPVPHDSAHCGVCYAKEVLKSEGIRKSFLK